MEGVGEVLAGDQRTWKQNTQGKWYAVGHACMHEVVRVKRMTSISEVFLASTET